MSNYTRPKKSSKQPKIIKQSPRRERYHPYNINIQEVANEVKKRQQTIAVKLLKWFPERKVSRIYRLMEIKRKQLICSEDDKNDMQHLEEIEKDINLLTSSLYVRILAVHRVITNKGARSTGVENYSPTTNVEYEHCIEYLRSVFKKPQKYRAKPLDRVYIPKKTKIDMNKIRKPSIEEGDTFLKEKGLRPLSIPTIKDRMVQAAVYIALEPYSEHFADKRSFAFRTGRSCGWAANAIAISLRGFFNPSWVVEVDVTKCFDRISHDWILENIPIINRHILKQWLSQGYIIRGCKQLGLQSTPTGVPQGGIISPVICNMVLDAIGEFLEDKFKNLVQSGVPQERLGYTRIRTSGLRRSQISIAYRYADDIVVLCRTKFVANKVVEYLTEFLDPRGLELSEEKTKVTDISGGTASFKFIGYEFIKATYGHKSKWFFVPPEENIRRLQQRITKLCKSDVNIPKLYFNYTSIVRSWCNYYYTANARRAFNRIHQWSFQKIYWAIFNRVKRIKSKELIKGKRNTSKKSVHQYIMKHYIKPVAYRGSIMNWFVLSSNKYRNKRIVLFCPNIYRLCDKAPLHKNGLSACLPNELKQIAEININYRYGLRAKVLKKFEGLEFCCHSCRNSLLDVNQGYHFHHILPVKYGGKTTIKNLAALCRQCHTDISSAVASHNIDAVEDYIRANLLEIPQEVLDNWIANK